MSYAVVARALPAFPMGGMGYGYAFGDDAEDNADDGSVDDSTDAASYSNPTPKYTNWGPGEIGSPPPGAYGPRIPLPPPASPAAQGAAWWGLAALLALPILL